MRRLEPSRGHAGEDCTAGRRRAPTARIAGAVFVILGLALAGCEDPAWRTTDISGVMPELEFELTDENGRTVRAADYRGQVALLFFGFTNCPDVCPVTLANLAKLADDIGAAPDDLRILFVSVDPSRDTLSAIKRYTDNFGPWVIGMTGAPGVLQALTRRYRVTYGYGDEDPSGAYDVSHSSAVFAFDRSGRARLLLRNSDPPESVRADLRRLLAEGA